MPLPLIRLKPLPYGGDRKPNDPTPEEIVEACRSMEFTIYRIGGDRTAANLLDALCLM